MQKMLVTSETEAEDQNAAIFITNEVRRGDCSQIVWYSDLGKRISSLETLPKKLGSSTKRIDSVESGICRLMTRIVDIENKLKEMVSVVKKSQEDLKLKADLDKMSEWLDLKMDKPAEVKKPKPEKKK